MDEKHEKHEKDKLGWTAENKGAIKTPISQLHKDKVERIKIAKRLAEQESKGS